MAPRGEPDIARIAVALSPERLAPYLHTTGGDLLRAVNLYEWNLAVSGALYEPWASLKSSFATP